MGLDTTHNCWHGSYGAFNRWRETVARVAGYLVRRVIWDEDMPLQDFQNMQKTVLLDWGAIKKKHYQGEWAGDEKILLYDPLVVLLVHSDCEGVISVREARMLLPRLASLVPKMAQAESSGSCEIGSTRRLELFIQGLAAAIEVGEEVEFA